ncbi:hypothetical protein CPB84DRAFT_1748277 [Gymnopilus junonius]|uniref:Uncharacterized protein n=1 Tax=Gymnopilus junonius TaxID=109634 RepID=A0A9P5NNC0_GYMJU|nr:hypothetical protein CPB84DRAFT_1748277 [Gymnopilus junonius]
MPSTPHKSPDDDNDRRNIKWPRAETEHNDLSDMETSDIEASHGGKLEKSANTRNRTENQAATAQTPETSMNKDTQDNEAHNAAQPQPFNLPKLDDMTGLPTNIKENPHTQMSQKSPFPNIAPSPKVPYMRAIFPRVVIPWEQLIYNLDDGQLAAITDNLDAFIAIVPFGAGDKYYRDHPTCNLF